ncbi:hypothetical protein ACWOEH_12245 [Enterococcus nangangensis]
MVTILRVIRNNLNVNFLINDEFSYSDLMKVINDLKKNGLIRDFLGKLELTSIGLSELNRLEQELKFGNIEKLIIPDYKYFIDKIGVNDVYLP